MSVYGGPDIITDGLVLHLDAGNSKSYPGSGSTWYDLSGQDNHVTKDATYQPTFNANGYFTFGGDGDNFETQSANTTLSSQITMICWYMQTGNGTGDPRILELNINGVSYPSSSNALAIDADGSLRAWIDIAGSSGSRRESRDYSTPLTKNVWRMYAYTYGPSSSSSVIYVNGSSVSSSLVATAVSNTDIDDVNIITIGAISDYGAVYSHPSNCFQGHASIFKVYNRALSADEIRQNYNALKGRYGLT